MSHSPAKAHYYNADAPSQRTSRRDETDRHERQHYQNGGDIGHGYQQPTTGRHHEHTSARSSSYADRTYSLPRTVIQQQQQQLHQQQMQQKQPGYYTQDRRSRSAQHQSGGNGHPMSAASAAGIDQPDFYFMPSQRKYSGEVVRVYVDYNKDPKN